MFKAILRFFRAFSVKLREDSVSAFASQAAFFIILSFFPFVMFLLTLIQYLPFTIQEISSFTSDLLPETVEKLLLSTVSEMEATASGTIISVTAVAALWSASRGVLALSRGLNSVYGHRETRNYFFLRSIYALYTLVFSVLLIISLVLLVFGNQIITLILNHIPLIKDFALLVFSMRFTIAMLFLTAFFLIIYLFVPNRRSSFFAELPGAVLSAGGWLGFSFLFSFYVENMSHYSAIYGSLTAIIICMLWLYACMYIFFIGAEVNVILAHPAAKAATAKLLRRFRKKGKRKS